MPTYVYRRPDGTTFDVFQKISDNALTEDPVSGVPVTRVISGGAGLQFKGDGFYITDYVKKSGPDTSDSGTSSTAKPAAKTDTASAASGNTTEKASSGGASTSD